MADEELTVDFELFGVPKAMAEIGLISRQIDKLPRAVQIRVDVLGRGMGKLAQAMALPPGQGSPVLQAAASSAQANARMNAVANPYKVGSVASGNQSLSQAIRNMIFSTRFSMNNGHLQVSPLVGRSMQALAKMGPLGVAIGATTAGLVLLNGAARSAAEAWSSASSARFMGGGSYADVNRAAGLGAVMGMSAGDVSRMAREFADALAHDPITRMEGVNSGIQNYMGSRGPGAKVNVFDDFFKGVQSILDAPNDEAAIRKARNFGPNMEKFLDMRLLSPEDQHEAMNMMQQMFGPDQAAAAWKYQMAVSRISVSMMKLEKAMTPVIDKFAGLLEMITGHEPTDKEKEAAKNNFNPFNNPYAKAQKSTEQNAKDKNAEALKSNTDALYAMQKSFDRLIFGGGERAQGAMPSHMRGAYRDGSGVFQQGLKAHAIGLGAFGI